MEIQVNNIRLHYRQSGSGPPLVLLHGSGEDHHIFDQLVQKLNPHFTVYAIDSRNHGQSEITTVYSYAVMAEDILAFLKFLAQKGLEDFNKSGTTPAPITPVKVLGYSDGAIIALLIALSHPEYMDKMALLGVNLSPADFTPETREEIVQMWEASHDPLAKLMLTEPHINSTDLRQIPTSALVIYGEYDCFRPELADEVIHAMNHARKLIIPGHDHYSYICNQDLMAPVLIDFFS